MTPEPTLTEEDIVISRTKRSKVNPDLDENQLFILRGFTYEEAIMLKQQILQALQLKKRIEEYIKNLKPYELEVACGEGETCTVTDQTISLLRELIKGDTK